MSSRTVDDVNKFWFGKVQSLCADCHNNAKQFVEHHGYRNDVGLDGWPLDANHPAYARERGDR